MTQRVSNQSSTPASTTSPAQVALDRINGHAEVFRQSGEHHHLSWTVGEVRAFHTAIRNELAALPDDVSRRDLLTAIRDPRSRVSTMLDSKLTWAASPNKAREELGEFLNRTGRELGVTTSQGPAQSTLDHIDPPNSGRRYTTAQSDTRIRQIEAYVPPGQLQR